MCAVSCKRFDPRCLSCNATACLSCADLILNSVRRSGARSIDAPLPFDEQGREFSRMFSFGSQDPGVFDEAEPYFVVLPPGGNYAGKYLNDSTKTCSQGTQKDASWSCSAFPASHRVCGHHGVFTLKSPLYEIAESAGNITVTVRRSGGGVGDVAVEYDLEHVTTTPDDVSPTAFYTSSQKLVFAEGVVELSFQVTIHDDFIPEANETFRLRLHPPSDPRATLGNQRSALVTIIDDDRAQTVALPSYVISPDSTLRLGGIANSTLRFNIQSVLGSNVEQRVSSSMATSDLYLIESYAMDALLDLDDDEAPRRFRTRQIGSVVNNGNGTYACAWNRSLAGNFTVAVYLLHPGGLIGEYFYDAWLATYQPSRQEQLPVIRRIDRHVNFTWGNGPAFSGASDYFSARWSGWLKPKITGETIFSVSADDHIRLWINDVLVLDRWDHHGVFANPGGPAESSVAIDLNSSLYYPVVLEYREISGNAEVHFYWSSASYSKEVIPMTSLFTAEHISGSPFMNIPVLPMPMASNASFMTSTVQGVLSSSSAAAGSEIAFDILPRDAFGSAWRNREATISDNSFAARLSLTTDQSLGGGLGSATSVDAVVVWDSPRLRFRGSVLPIRSGLYNLDIWITNRTNVNSLSPLPGGSFPVRVMSSRMSPMQSVISGIGIQANRVAGVPAVILLEARDAYKNRIYNGDSVPEIKVQAIHSSVVGPQTAPFIGAVVLGSASDNGDGTYVLTYTPQLSGTYQVSIRLGNTHIANSPYSVSVIPNIPAAAMTTAVGSALTSASTNVQTSFQITTRDAWGNLVLQGGAVFQVSLAHTTKGNVAATCVDNLNGKYTCSYTAKYVGDSSAVKLHVALVSSGLAVEISGSPFSVNAIAGPALGSLSVAEGTALVSAIAGVQTNFSIRVHDYYDNVKTNAGQEAIVIQFSRPAPSTSILSSASAGVLTQYAGDGLYVVSYRLTAKGSYTLRVKVDGTDVTGSPFTMYTFPAQASPSTTTIDLVSPAAGNSYFTGALITAQITTRDLFSNTLETGGYTFHFHPNARYAINSVVDQGNGGYQVTLRPTKAQFHTFEPKIVLPGGLNATYMTSADAVLSGSSNVKLKRIDPSISVDFGVLPPLLTDTMTAFSIRWRGFIKPRYTEVYTFSAQVEGGISVDVNGIPALPTKLWPRSYQGQGVGNGIALTSGALVEIDVNYTKHSDLPSGSVSLHWQSLSQPREVIPSSVLFTSWRIGNNVPPLDIVPSISTPTAFTAVFDPSALETQVIGTITRSIVRGVAGKTLSFIVTARDAFSNPRRSGGDKIFVLFPELSSPSAISPTSTSASGAITTAINDHGNGNYSISFVPIWSGEFSMVVASSADPSTPTTGSVSALDIFLQGSNIRGSPFTLVFEPNVATAVDSTMVGTGFALATAGVETCIILEPRDLHGNQLLPNSAVQTLNNARVKLTTVVGGEFVETRADVQAATSISSSTLLSLSVCYAATVTGIHRVLLSFDAGVSYTEKSSTLRIYPNVATAAMSTLQGDGIMSTISTGTFYTYQITARDAWGNALETGGDRFVVQLRGPQDVWGTITDLLNGQYVVTYLVALPGEYELETRLAGRHQPHGLSALYFPDTQSINHSAVSIPVYRTVDPNIAFNWQIDPSMRGFPRIQWSGYLIPQFTEVYTLWLEVSPSNGAALYINGIPVIDAVNADPPASDNGQATTLKGTISVVRGRLHPILIEYRSRPAQDPGQSRLILSWQSTSQSLEVVPSSALVAKTDEIRPRHRLTAT